MKFFSREKKPGSFRVRLHGTIPNGINLLDVHSKNLYTLEHELIAATYHVGYGDAATFRSRMSALRDFLEKFCTEKKDPPYAYCDYRIDEQFFRAAVKLLPSDTLSQATLTARNADEFLLFARLAAQSYP